MMQAEQEIRQGRWQIAIARADCILLNTPIRVWLGYEPASRGSKGYVKIIQRAMEIWQKAMDDETLFTLVDNPEQADVRIGLVEKIQCGESYSGGRISWDRKIVCTEEGGFETQYRAEITLALSGPRGRRLNAAQMIHAAAHELGHVLGLQDSFDVGPIMGPLDLRRPARKPSVKETLALKEVRALANDIRRQAFAIVL